MRAPSIDRIALVCARHPWRTIAAWAAAVVGSLALVAALLGGVLTTDTGLTTNPESSRALRLLYERYPGAPYVDEIVVVRHERRTVDEPAFRRTVERVVAAGAATGAVGSVRSWYETRDPSLVSRDRHATMLPLVLAFGGPDRIGQLVAVARRLDGPGGYEVAITGGATADRDFEQLSSHDLTHGELFFGLPAALVVLVLVFGALAATALPLLLALVSIAVALGLVAVVGQELELSIFVVNMLTGMGLALGIDYSLLVVSRFREERAAGREPLDAIAACAATSSRAVAFSGSAFVLAMIGMVLVPDTVLRSLAVGAILVSFVAVAGALTLLPALL